MYGLSIEHNMEVAHRLTKLGGKCENIHGHSMLVRLQVFGPSQLDEKDLMAGMDFGSMKRGFRAYIDGEYDHRLLLWENDPLALVLQGYGLKVLPVDPTTEALAGIIGKDMRDQFGLENLMYNVQVMETRVNGAFWQG